MKKIFAAVWLCVILLLPATTNAQNVQNFTIESFEADYYLTRDENNVSELKVEETIVALFPNFNQNRGILRAIPKKYNGKSLQLKIGDVTNENGAPYKLDTYTENDNLVLKIGDPNVFMLGRTVYKINYQMREVVSFDQEHDEFYWDINGDQWPQTFGQVTARVHLEGAVKDSFQDRQVCFTGTFGSTSQNCEIVAETDDDTTTVTARAQNLGRFETLTIALAFNDNTFSPDKRAEFIARLVIFLSIALFLALPLTTALIVYKKWRRHGRDPKGRGVIIPQYLPPKRMDAALAYMVLNEKLNTKAITAGILELATNKFLTIYELDGKPKDWELEVIKEFTGLSSNQGLIVNALFGTSRPQIGERVKLSSLKNKLYKDVTKISNNAATESATLGYFVSDPIKAKNRFIVATILMFMFGFTLLFTGIGAILGISLMLSGVIAFVGSRAMPARTEKGVEMKEYLEGMQQYIKLAEVERLKYLQSPEGAKRYGDIKDNKTRIKLFEKILPYAMIFGLEKKWAQEFKDLYSEQQQPSWYRGNNFNTAYMASSLNSFAASSAASFSAPASSSSGGFSGGGSSGGGGGGGGGGGW